MEACKYPPTKWRRSLERPPIDFQLSVKCEGAKLVKVKGKGCVLEPLVTPNAETYQKFVKERAKYGNAEYVRLEQRLHGLTADELKRKNALWHRTYYSERAHKQHTKRAQDRYEKVVKCEDLKCPVIQKSRRSSYTNRYCML